MATNNDAQWIASAYKVLGAAQKAMHVSEIEELIRTSSVDSSGPSMSLEVLLTREAAMGRKFTKPDGSPPGFFSLLPPQQANSEEQGPTSPPSASQNFSTSSESTAALDIRYQHKYNQLKKKCKQMIYLNAALYDDVARIEKKIERCSKERLALLQKVMADQNIVNHKKAKGKSQQTSASKSADSESAAEASASVATKRKTKVKDEVQKKLSSPPKRKKTSNDEDEEEELSVTALEEETSKLGETSTVIPKSPSSVKHSDSIRIPPINLDPAGRPILPLHLPAGLRIYSIGEICEKAGYSTNTSIYPVGYCCTRTYACCHDPSTKCLYTCKISDGPTGPKFEISADTDQTTVFVDDTSEGCHNQLLRLLNYVTSRPVALTVSSDFFGLNHPVVKNLLQCSQGASSCIAYQPSKFEVVKGGSELSKVMSELDPASSFRSLMKYLNFDATDDQNSPHDQSSESDDSTE